MVVDVARSVVLVIGAGNARRRFVPAALAASPSPLAPPARHRAASRDLPAARLDFADALADVRSLASFELQSRIAVTRSLHELWHLREQAFSLISRSHSQSEAARRLASLNRHFA